MNVLDRESSNRREFLAALGLTGLALTPLQSWPALVSDVEFDAIARDLRFEASRTFAATLASRRTAIIEAMPDVYESWRAISRGRSIESIAGLTTYADYLSLRGSFMPHRLRVVHEAFVAGGTLVHWVALAR